MPPAAPDSPGRPDPPRAAGARGPALLVLALIAGAALFSVFAVGQGYWCDDSFISYRYARHLVEGHGLVYNPGDPVEGYSNFLWTMVAALGIALSFEPIYFTQGAALVAQAATLWFVFRLGGLLGRTGWQAVLAPALLSVSVAFVAYPMTGMETSLFVALTTGAFLLLAGRAEDSRGRGALLGLVLLGMAMTRIDGFVPIALLLSFPLLFERRWRLLGWPLLVLVVGLVAWHGWRLSYYPTALPNTFHAKTDPGAGRRYVYGLLYLRDFALGQGMPVLLLAVVPLALWSGTRRTLHLGWVVLGQAGYAAMVGGDWMPHSRFFLPILPLICLLAQDGVFLLADRLGSRLGSPRVVAGVLCAVLLAGHARLLLEENAFSELEDKHFAAHEAKRIGEALTERFPGDLLIAIEWGGILPYYTKHRVLDLYGLTDRAIVATDHPKTVWGTRVPPQYIASRRPDVVAPCARIWPTREEAIASVRPGGPCHYSFYPQMTQLGYEYKMVPLGPDAWWPALVRRDRAQ